MSNSDTPRTGCPMDSDIKISPAMIQAGLAVLRESGALGGLESSADPLLVRDILQAALLVREADDGNFRSALERELVIQARKIKEMAALVDDARQKLEKFMADCAPCSHCKPVCQVCNQSVGFRFAGKGSA